MAQLSLQLWDTEEALGWRDVTAFATDIKPREFLQQVPDIFITQKFRFHTPGFPSPVENLLSYLTPPHAADPGQTSQLLP